MVCLPLSVASAPPQLAFLPPPRHATASARPASTIRSLIIVAAGGRHLDWPPLRIAAALQAHTAGRQLHGLFHGGARRADLAIAAAARHLAWPTQAFLAEWARHGLAADQIRNADMISRACDLAAARSRSVPTAVAIIALPGSQGAPTLLAQARHLQSHAGFPFEISNLSGHSLPLMPAAVLRPEADRWL